MILFVVKMVFSFIHETRQLNQSIREEGGMREHLRQAYEPGRKGVAGVHLLGGPLWEARVGAEIR